MFNFLYRRYEPIRSLDCSWFNTFSQIDILEETSAFAKVLLINGINKLRVNTPAAEQEHRCNSFRQTFIAYDKCCRFEEELNTPLSTTTFISHVHNSIAPRRWAIPGGQEKKTTRIYDGKKMHINLDLCQPRWRPPAKWSPNRTKKWKDKERKE